MSRRASVASPIHSVSAKFILFWKLCTQVDSPMGHFRMVTGAVEPHQAVGHSIREQPMPPLFSDSSPPSNTHTTNSNCFKQLSSSCGMKVKHITESMYPLIPFCHRGDKNRLYYGQPNSIFFVACLPNYIIHNSMLLPCFHT